MSIVIATFLVCPGASENTASYFPINCPKLLFIIPFAHAPQPIHWFLIFLNHYIQPSNLTSPHTSLSNSHESPCCVSSPPLCKFGNSPRLPFPRSHKALPMNPQLAAQPRYSVQNLVTNPKTPSALYPCLPTSTCFPFPSTALPQHSHQPLSYIPNPTTHVHLLVA